MRQGERPISVYNPDGTFSHHDGCEPDPDGYGGQDDPFLHNDPDPLGLEANYVDIYNGDGTYTYLGHVDRGDMEEVHGRVAESNIPAAVQARREAREALARREARGTANVEIGPLIVVGEAPNSGTTLMLDGRRPGEVANVAAINAAAQVKPGSYNNLASAQLAAGATVHQLATKYPVEYAGYVYMKDGKYSYTVNTLGLVGVVDTGKVPAGGVGMPYHNHLALGTSASYWPSDHDYRMSLERGGQVHIFIDPKGGVYTYQDVAKPTYFFGLLGGGLDSVGSDRTVKPVRPSGPGGGG